MASNIIPVTLEMQRDTLNMLAVQMPDLVFRLGDASELPEIQRLAYLEYRRSGYIASNRNEMMHHYHHRFDHIPETHLLVARRQKDQKLLGTMSVTVDGPNGIPTDVDFPSETELLRINSEKLCQVWRFAIDCDHRTSSRVLFGLMSLSWFSDFTFDISTVVATIHPKHLGFYQILGFEPIAFQPCAYGLTNAPALMIGITERKFTMPEEQQWGFMHSPKVCEAA